MKCRACAKQPFSIRTNPQGRCFDYVSGIRKKIEEFDPVEAGTLGVIDTTANNGKNTIHSDLIVASDGVFENLEKQVAVKQQKMTERDSMELLLRHRCVLLRFLLLSRVLPLSFFFNWIRKFQIFIFLLIYRSNATMYNDSVSNSKLRSAYRTSRKARKRRLGDAKRIGLRAGIEISEPIPDDARIAKAIFDKKAIQSLRSHSRNQDFCSDLRASSIFMSTEGYENVKRKEKHYNIRATLVNPDRNKTHSIPNKNLDSDISSAVIRFNQKQTSKDDNSIENDISSLLALQGYESDEE